MMSSDEDIIEDKELMNDLGTDDDGGEEEDEDNGDDTLIGKKRKRENSPQLELDGQYRGRHFEMKNGILHSYLPKICNLSSTKFYLYCWKLGCKGKIRIDMVNKKAKDIIEHNNHRGVIIENFIDEYPEISEKNWTNIQYDVKNNKKICMWKI